MFLEFDLPAQLVLTRLYEDWTSDLGLGIRLQPTDVRAICN